MVAGRRGGGVLGVCLALAIGGGWGRLGPAGVGPTREGPAACPRSGLFAAVGARLSVLRGVARLHVGFSQRCSLPSAGASRCPGESGQPAREGARWKPPGQRLDERGLEPEHGPLATPGYRGAGREGPGLAALVLGGWLGFVLAVTALSPGLYGREGILPARRVLRLGGKGLWEQLRDSPTLLWLSPHLGLDTELGMELLCLLGVFASFSALLFESLRDSLLFALLWALYLSLYQVGDVSGGCLAVILRGQSLGIGTEWG